MKKIFAALLLIVLFSSLPFAVLAQNIESKQDVVLAKDQVIDRDYFAGGNSVFLEGTVNGDAYIAGGNVVVDGTVNGDLITAGGNINIKGTITGNIRAAGGNINISGTIGRNATLAGGSINLASNANLSGSLASAGGNLAIFAPIGKEANLAGGQVVIGSSVGSDVNAAVGALSLAPTATISGNLTYLSENPASIAPGAVILGKTTQNIPPQRVPEETARKGAKSILAFFAVGDFILATVLGILLIKLLPVYFKKTTGLITQKPWINLGLGFLAVILFPFIFLLLLVTIIGIPIAILLAIALAILCYLAKIFVSFVIGQLILGRFSKGIHEVWALILGLIIYFAVTSIPILGWLIAAISGLIGLGAILIEKKNYYRDLRTKQII